MSQNELFQNSLPQLSSIKEGLRVRFADPFLGTFSISFLIWNYQIILFVFSDLSPGSKYLFIQNTIDAWSFVAPILITAFLMLILPILLIKAHAIYEKNVIKIENIRHEAQKELITISNQLEWAQQRFHEEVNKGIQFNNTLSDKNQEIGKLSQQITSLEKNIIEREQENSILISELEKLKKPTPPSNPDAKTLETLRRDSEKFKQVLRNNDISEEIFLSLRDYSESHNLAATESIRIYKDGVLSLVRTVQNKNAQSKTISNAFKNFKLYFDGSSWLEAASVLRSMMKVSTLKKSEIEMLRVADDLLREIHRYTE